MIGNLGTLHGMPVTVSAHALDTKQVRFPRSKKKRIRKKFKKNRANYKSSPGCYLVGNRMLVHPEIYSKVQQHMEML